jgi:ubiquinone/menaquinone biosynthesis C-methylase UbiE
MLEAEREFWDEHAERQIGTDWRPRHDEIVEHIIAAAGDIHGLRVLDLGCGMGDLAIRLVDEGAHVTALDASAGQVRLAREVLRRARPGANVEFVVAPAEATGLPSQDYDVIVGKWILHHIDLPSALPEVWRLLRPGGRGVFYENHDRNALLALSRRHLAGRATIRRFGTATERPISRSDLALLRRTFSDVELDYPEFFCFRLLSSRALHHRGYGLSRRLDKLTWRIPWLRPLSWHVVVTVTR